MKIVQITAQDNVDDVCKQLHPSRWGKDNDMSLYDPIRLREYVLNERNFLIVGYEDDQIVCSSLCYVLAHPDKTRSSLYVDELDTHPDYRRKGYATQMMRWLQSFAGEQGVSEVWLGTEAEDNVGANAFYTALKPDEVVACNLYSYKSTS